jgi:hypothetical protein
MESRGHSQGGTRPRSCCSRAGHYAQGLARHDLVAALHVARRRLSPAEAPPSPPAARTLIHGAHACAYPRPHACAAARTLVLRWPASRFRLRYTESLLLVRATPPLSRRPRWSGDPRAGGTFLITIRLASGIGGRAAHTEQRSGVGIRDSAGYSCTILWGPAGVHLSGQQLRIFHVPEDC